MALFLKALVLITGLINTVAIGLVAGMNVIDAFPNTYFVGGIFGTFHYPIGQDWIVAIGALVATVIAVVGVITTAQVIARMDDN